MNRDWYAAASRFRENMVGTSDARERPTVGRPEFESQIGTHDGPTTIEQKLTVNSLNKVKVTS